MFKLKGLGSTAGIAWLSAFLLLCSQNLLSAQSAKDAPPDTEDVFSFKRCVNRLAIAPDGRTFVTGGGIYPNRGELIWWDLKTGKALRVIRKHRLAIWSVAFAPDGKTVASGGDDGDAKIWDITTGELLCDLIGHRTCVQSISFSADQSAVVTTGGYDDWTVKVWDARTGKLRRNIPFPRDDAIFRAVLFPDGGTAVVSTYAKPLRFFRLASGEELDPMENHADSLGAILISADGKTLVTSGGPKDKTVRVWDLPTRRLRWTFKGHTDSVPCLSLSADGKRLASGSLDHTARIWDLETGKNISVLKGHTSSVQSVGLTPDGKAVVTLGEENRIKIWDADAGKERTGPADK